MKLKSFIMYSTIEFKNLNPTATEKQLFLHSGLYLVENNETALSDENKVGSASTLKVTQAMVGKKIKVVVK